MNLDKDEKKYPTIIDKLIDFFETCPYINSNSPINVDYLGDEIGTYSVDGSPAETILNTYVDGSTERQLMFNFTSREAIEVYDNTENTIFYENLANWVEEQNKLGNLPKLDYPLQAEKIKVITDGYAEQISANKAIYIIQMQLVYYKWV